MVFEDWVEASGESVEILATTISSYFTNIGTKLQSHWPGNIPELSLNIDHNAISEAASTNINNLYNQSAIMAQPFVLDLPTILCLAMAFAPMPIAWVLGKRLIPEHHELGRVFFWWHAYDALTHFLIEGSFLYHAFFSTIPISPTNSRFGPVFLNRRDRAHGAMYGAAADPTARLWQEYAKADHRWGGADPNVVSIELLTVLLGGPAAAYICWALYRLSHERLSPTQRGLLAGRVWFVAACLATAELYGGFMTFVPEWLSGSPALNTSHWMYVVVYLTFFNGLWVVVPIWIIWQALREVSRAFVDFYGGKAQGAPELMPGAANAAGASSRKK
ncbi:EXPERA domain-containing protein [Aspergillus homomorphus CBS 101889]|uniref:EBP-domain-containing protein n=1 Tax=Aspergillus homomorphus (strain CBS 101889) TaxID=1450537 RepID=A0A395I275_ASPHC|nr:EBP-domain-containing protein [Aspergillus homomorphus CBS 101889]RAL13816.1 EBP-domain-containing protein [Aspergillus homomorphus CBS 101889]